MEIPNQNEIEGGLDQAGGEIKEGIGRLVGDEQLENEGIGEQIAGEIQEGYGRLERNIERTAGEIEDRVQGH